MLLHPKQVSSAAERKEIVPLTLGLDRNTALVAELCDERHPTVLEMLRLAICSAKRCGRKIGICGQPPSDHPDFSAFLVREGIDSSSPKPDAVIDVRLTMAELEKQLS